MQMERLNIVQKSAAEAAAGLAIIIVILHRWL